MKRDMDLIRLLLIRIEDGHQLVSKGDSEPQVLYHLALLVDAGYVDGVIARNGAGTPVGSKVQALTWKGHEFLDAIRKDTVWVKTKDAVAKAGVGFTVDALKTAAVAIYKATVEGAL